MTVYWVVWDAAAHWVVDRLEREGALPAVRRMRSHGTLAAARPARPNCQTPPSLATLFTGTWPSEHGVTGFTVPDAGGAGRAGHVSGFSPGFPAAPPVWETASEHDLTSSFVHAPWVFDGAGRTSPFVSGAIEAYSERLARHAVLELRTGAGPAPLAWEIADWKAAVEVESRSGSGDGTAALQVWVDSGRERVQLAPGEAWRPLALDATAGTWVGCVRVGDRLLLAHTGVWRARTGGQHPKTVGRLRNGVLPFAGEGVGPLYREGVFGPRIAEGGDGSAEEVFLNSVRCVARHFGDATDAVLDTHDSDLVVVYLPMTDDVGHELLGWCDERSAAWRADLADRVWAYVRRCYQWSDAILGRVLDRAGPEDTVVLGADHGMVGSTHLVHLNERLVRAGLAAATPDGGLDPDRSQVFYHPANNGSLWAGSAVSADSAAARSALLRAMAALSDIADPAIGGRPVVAGFLDQDGVRLPDGDPGSAQVVYVALADDYQPTASLLGEGAVVRPVPKTGAHVVNTGDTRLHAVHAAAGPGIPHTDGAVIDNTRPAALVLRQLGAHA